MTGVHDKVTNCWTLEVGHQQPGSLAHPPDFGTSANTSCTGMHEAPLGSAWANCPSSGTGQTHPHAGDTLRNSSPIWDKRCPPRSRDGHSAHRGEPGGPHPHPSLKTPSARSHGRLRGTGGGWSAVWARGPALGSARGARNLSEPPSPLQPGTRQGTGLRDGSGESETSGQEDYFRGELAIEFVLKPRTD